MNCIPLGGKVNKRNMKYHVIYQTLMLLSSSDTRGILKHLFQGIRIKGREMALVWHEKASLHCFADEFPFTHEHSFGTDT